ncbi:hypothetical protein QYE76_029294 [Lolium multiflorum]|uniref:Replication protein A C-terminal domain-containing protein n=1 Tax=Lolium multiflorum TaxID=4521 RepID=A0AAD8QNW8_LOLMU|nr:hypothetical protein QYE76_029294 [Lolium multiflorum]
MDQSNGENGSSLGKSYEAARAIVHVPCPGFIQASPATAQLHQTSIRNYTSVQERDPINREKTLMPVNTKQIKYAWMGRTNEYMVINNTVVSTVKIIGQMRGMRKDEYKGTFKIEDCCGVLKASIWFTGERDELDCVSEGAYVAVIGRIKLDDLSPEIQCYDCRPIRNFNDITHHHLSVITTHIDLVQKPTKGVYARVAELWAEDMEGAGSKVEQQTTCTLKPADHEKPNSGVVPKTEILSQEPKDVSTVDTEVANHKIPSISEDIMQLLRLQYPKDGPEGVHIEWLCKELKLNEELVRGQLMALALDGELYTTIDTEHFAPT